LTETNSTIGATALIDFMHALQAALPKKYAACLWDSG
jgi:hypothetical protein